MTRTDNARFFLSFHRRPSLVSPRRHRRRHPHNPPSRRGGAPPPTSSGGPTHRAALFLLRRRRPRGCAPCSASPPPRGFHLPAPPATLSDYDDFTAAPPTPALSISVSGHCSLSNPSSISDPVGRFQPPFWIPPPHTPPPSASSPPAAAPRSAPRCARSPGITRLQTPREHGAWTKASAGGGTLTRADDSSERKHSSSRTASERLHDDGLWPATIASRIPGDCCAPIWSGNLAGAVPTLPAWYFAFSFCFDAGAGRCGKRRWLRCHGVLCISERKWTRGHARHNDGLRRACEVHC